MTSSWSFFIQRIKNIYNCSVYQSVALEMDEQKLKPKPVHINEFKCIHFWTRAVDQELKIASVRAEILYR